MADTTRADETTTTEPTGAPLRVVGDDARSGIKLDRFFTTPGRHPYDDLTWELRDAVLTNWRDGSLSFEQRGVEFPSSWSMMATQIVSQKYFRGTLNTPQREHSVRQMVDRVADTITGWGIDGGYFVDDETAEVFNAELKHLLVNQKAAFNSPVWFNVGVEEKPQCSACFILAVEDTMSSILNWYVEEGTIFKGGSGAGINLSTIRSSKEILKGGGEASGPVSFMRGADASAGTIKSGGKTRRAAKMVILNVDHPDIEEFIWTKAREEKKVRVLREAGFDMDLDGEDYASIQYQNANNSVRVTDEFMEAYERGTSYPVRAVTTGEVHEEKDARDVMRQISEAAWECADPGLQYDTTINDWHTSPESGRINGSNPCFPADALVHTDKGLIRFDELIDRVNHGEVFGVYTHDATNPDEPTEQVQITTPKAFMLTGSNEIVRLTFSNGMELRCTPNHRIWTMNRGYVEAQALTAEDQVKLLDLPAPAVHAELRLPIATDVESYAAKGHHAAALIRLPEKWTEDFAHYLGWLIGDGSISGDMVSTSYGSAEDRGSVLPRHLEQVAWMNGGREPTPSLQANGTVQLRQSRKAIRGFLEALGVSDANAAGKRLPWSIRQAPPEIVGAFLRGLFDADGCVRDGAKDRYVGLGSRSLGLLQDVQVLLTTLGVHSRIYTTEHGTVSEFHYTKTEGTEVTYEGSWTGYDLRITAGSLERFAAGVGFSLPSKSEALTRVLSEHVRYRTDTTVRMVERVSQGYEQTYNLSEPRNHSYVVGGVVVRNCSEYMHLDNSACNLASLNLKKFYDYEAGRFDVEAYKRAVEIVFTAQEIVVGYSSYPTERIGQNAIDFRELGLGYANLGGLLMSLGLPYDSDEGRAWAGALTALMTGHAYRTSAELSRVKGPHNGYAKNEQPMLRVIGKHRAAVDDIDPRPVPAELMQAARTAWDEALELGEEHGYRNAQATVLAPTGTIGLMMDCDTTGIEPDLGLVKMKKMVGGGSITIVNQTVPQALRHLGYTEEQVEAIVAYIDEHKTIHGAPAIKREHLKVFQCAMGDDAIHYMGHVKMMAAAQPFISGAISKTVNLPESATVEDIEQLHVDAWKLGIKAIAIYRDNCKVAQPLSVSKKAEAKVDAPVEVSHVPMRRRLPKTRPSQTISFAVGDAKGYITAGEYPGDGLGEIFVKLGKQGSTLSGLLDAFAISVSIGLQYGVPLETYVSKFMNMRFEPAGMTDDEEIRFSTSIVDYLARKLAIEYLPFEKRSELGIHTLEERNRMLDEGYGDQESPVPTTPTVEAVTQAEPVPQFDGSSVPVDHDAPMCFECGIKMKRAGACHVCESCGTTSGCS
jgi:ribonucleoside-diphosphate reductase alpha chain